MFNKKIQRTLASGVIAIALATTLVPMGMTGSVKAASTQLRLLDVQVEQASAVVMGDTVIVSALTDGGVGELLYTYKVMLPNGNFETIAKDVSVDSINYTMTEKGIYNFFVEVTDENSFVYDVRECQVNADKITIDSVKLNQKSYKKADEIKFDITATPASGTAKTKVVVKTPAGKTVSVKKLSTKSTATYKFAKKGTYTFTITAKDSKTTVSVTKKIVVK